MSIVEVHQEISAVADRRRSWPTSLKVEPGSAALEMQRTYKTSDGEIAQVTVNTHPSASRFRPFDDHAVGSVRVDESHMPTRIGADCGFARHWPTRCATPRTHARADVLVDGDIRLDCQSLHTQADGAGADPAVADADGQRGVVHAAELARGRRHLPRRPRWPGWSVNPILPSLRDRELQFILDPTPTAG